MGTVFKSKLFHRFYIALVVSIAKKLHFAENIFSKNKKNVELVAKYVRITSGCVL